MKTNNKKKRNRERKAKDKFSDEEDLSEIVAKIKDDGGDMETTTGDGEDIPAAEIDDVIKRLKLDRYKDDALDDSPKKQLKSKKENVKSKNARTNKSTEESSSLAKSPDAKGLGTSKSQKEKSKKKHNAKQTVKDTNTEQSKNKSHNKVKKTAATVADKANIGKGKVQEQKSSTITLSHSKSSSLLLPTGVKWFTIPGAGQPEGNVTSVEGVVSTYLEHATKLYDNEVEIYAARKSKESDSQSRWMQTVAKSGALSDKVAALTLEVQGAPVHTPLSLDGLLGMVRKKGRREALLGLDAVKGLFLEELLPSNRKLKSFSQHSFEEVEKRCKKDVESRDKQVLVWYFEDQIKQKYGIFLDIIEKMLQDTVSAIKSKALSACYELLVNRPEQEKRLLRLIVNKVGDPDYKVAAKAVHWLQKLVEVHTVMKIVVVQAVEELLFRPNISTKAQYYAICFLNQLVLHPEEDNLATQLIIVYLSFFKACTKQKKIDNKMLAAVITGVHRAFPFSKEDEKVHEQLDTLMKVIHRTTFNTSIQALLLVKQVLDKRKATMERFYSALYRKLLDPQLSTSPRHAMFLNLLFQTLKEDEVINRVKAFVKRLLQVCSWQQPPFIAAVLVLVSELIRLKPSLGILNSWTDDSDDEHFVDLEEDEKEEGEAGTSTNAELQGSGADTSSWVHRQMKKDEGKGPDGGYDVLARNPLHSHVDNAVMWELKVLSKHFHPSVALFASQLLAGTIVSYTGNPLQDFTSTRFLDRFVYRNPKQKLIGKESVMQPKSRSYKPPAVRNLAVNSKDFTSLTEDNVPIDEMFFHRFFSQKDTKGKKTQVKKDETTKSAQEDGEDQEEEETDDDDEEEDDAAANETLDDVDSDASSVDDDEFDKILDEMEDNMEDDEGEDSDIDFAGEFQKKSVGKKSKKRKAQDEEEDSSTDDDDEDEDDDDDEGIDNENEDEPLGQSEDIEGLDEEAYGKSDEEDEDIPAIKSAHASKRKQKQRNKGAKKQKKGHAELKDVTEQVSSMIDENVGSKFDTGLNALANKDKADMKQLRWEVDRDRWVRGKDARSKIRAKKLSRGPKAKGFKGKMKGKHKR